MHLRIVLAACFVAFIFSSAAPAQNWTRIIGESNIVDVSESSSGTYAVVSNSRAGATLVRLDSSSGDVVATTAFDEPSPSGVVASRNCVFALGYHDSMIEIIALDSSLRSERFHVAMTSAPAERLYSAAPTADGGLVLAGSRGEIAEVVKLSAGGQAEWRKLYAIPAGSRFDGINETSDGYLAWGIASCCGLVVKIDRAGGVAWTRMYRGAGILHYACALPNGDIATVGYLRQGSNGGVWLQRLDRSGNEVLEMLANIDAGSTSAAWMGRSLLVRAETSEGRHFVMDVAPDGMILQQTVVTVKNSNPSETAGSTCYLARGRTLTAIRSIGPPVPCVEQSKSSLQFRPVEKAGESIKIEVSDEETTFVKPAMKYVAATSKALACTPPAAQRAAALPQPRKSNVEEILAKAEAFETRIRQAFVARDFDTLESLAAECRRTTEEPRPAYTNLDDFYLTISYPGLRSQIPVARHAELLEEWRRAKPTSMAARLATALFHLGRADQLEGAPVTDGKPAQASSETALAMFFSAVDSVPVEQADPLYFYVAVVSARRRRIDATPAVMQSLNRATVGATLKLIARTLFAESGEATEAYAAFSEKAASASRSRYGDGLYAELAFAEATEGFSWNDAPTNYVPFPVGDRTIFDELHFSWPRVRQGYRDLIARFPAWVPLYHRFARMAVLAGDRETARELFAKPELDWSAVADFAWNRAEYARSKEWAEEATVGQLLRQQAMSRGLRANLTMSDGSRHELLNTFLMKTPNGIAAVIAIPATTETAALDSFRLNIRAWEIVGGANGGSIRARRRPQVMYGPTGRQSRLAVALLDSVPADLGAPVLTQTSGSQSPRAVVLACANGTASCTPRQIEGHLEFDDPNGFEFIFVPDQPVDFAPFIGSPVIRQGVNGVVVGRAGGNAKCEGARAARDQAAAPAVELDVTPGVRVAPASPPPSRGTSGGS